MGCKQLGSQICIFRAGLSGLIFNKCDGGSCSGQLRALNSQRRGVGGLNTPCFGCSLRETLDEILLFFFFNPVFCW